MGFRVGLLCAAVLPLAALAQAPADFAHCGPDSILAQEKIVLEDKTSEDARFDLQETLFGDLLKVDAASKPNNPSLPPAYLRTCLERKKKLIARNYDLSPPGLKASFRMQALMGQIQDHLGAHEKALGFYKRALAANPRHYPTLRRGYDTWTKKQIADFAAADIRQLDTKRMTAFFEQSNEFAGPILNTPDAPKELKVNVLRTRAELLTTYGREADAMQDYQKILAIDPENRLALKRLAEFERTRNRPAEMRKHLEKLAPLDRKDLAVQLNLLELQYRQEDSQSLLTTATAVESAHPNRTDVLAYKSFALVKNGRGAEGEKLVREALRRDPTNRVARATLSGIHRAQAEKLRTSGQPGGALAEYAEALRLNPDDLRLRERMALLIYDYRKSENFQPIEASKKDLDHTLDLLDPLLKQPYVSQGTLQVYVAAAARSSKPHRGSAACDRYERDYGSLPDVDFVLDCASSHRDAGKDIKARTLLENALKFPRYKAGSERLFDALKRN